MRSEEQTLTRIGALPFLFVRETGDLEKTEIAYALASPIVPVTSYDFS